MNQMMEVIMGVKIDLFMIVIDPDDTQEHVTPIKYSDYELRQIEKLKNLIESSVNSEDGGLVAKNS
ncbi:hypothetical protein [Photobacterium leiognathi]|uniref:hypothetical protein n=1 Tax=Photobacterium leiognathi TaxID=553611 RepID=UPI00273883D4|nr:hypothetical protein [Photobacterium leiognathi]